MVDRLGHFPNECGAEGHVVDKGDDKCLIEKEMQTLERRTGEH
jgi:hypothetical protein